MPGRDVGIHHDPVLDTEVGGAVVIRHRPHDNLDGKLPELRLQRSRWALIIGLAKAYQLANRMRARCVPGRDRRRRQGPRAQRVGGDAQAACAWPASNGRDGRRARRISGHSYLVRATSPCKSFLPSGPPATSCPRLGDDGARRVPMHACDRPSRPWRPGRPARESAQARRCRSRQRTSRGGEGNDEGLRTKGPSMRQGGSASCGDARAAYLDARTPGVVERDIFGAKAVEGGVVTGWLAPD
jgi:hypothetical protein